MKTIFVTIFQGVEAKNILRTNVYRELIKRGDVRLVFFVRTPERRAYYEREFTHPRVAFEVAAYRPGNLCDRLLSKFTFQLLRTKTTDLRRRMELEVRQNRAAYVFGLSLNRMFARPLVRKLLRRLDARLSQNDSFRDLFERYRPSAVFLAHLFDDVEIALLREAKRRRVPTIGFINSWDKLTARSAIRLLPDHLLVYNDIVKHEAMEHADMPAERIRVVGIPQYDLYVGYRPVPREEFMRRIGIDPTKRFFLYAPMGEAFSNSDWDVIDLLHRWIGEGALAPDADFLVRFQPNDSVNEAERSKRPWLHFDRPGTRFSRTRGVDWDMSEIEMRHLADTLSHASLLVCYASSLSVDAAAFDLPVINIDFELSPVELLAKSPTQFYQMTHYGNAIRTGGIRRVSSPDELQHWICTYLERPDADHEGRVRLVREQCGPFDGRAGERIAEAILDSAGASG